MQKLSVMLVALACGSLMMSCGTEGGMSAKTKKNIEVNNAIMKAYESGDFSKMGDYIAADAVDHGGENGDVTGLDSIVSEMKRYQAMMPDMKSSNVLTVGNDDYVFTRATMSGTMNGKQTTMTSVDVSRFVDGKAVEHWIYMNPSEVMSMMMPPPAPAMPADSSAKMDGTKK